MLAGLLVISILAGGLAAGATVALSLPVWAAMLAYPIGGTVGLAMGMATMLMPGLSQCARQEILGRRRV